MSFHAQDRMQLFWMMYKNLLLIDDDDEDQEIFLSALRKLEGQFSCFTESNAQLAFQKLAAGEIVVDVIFLDLNMPIMTGQEFLVAIKKDSQLSHIPIVIFSTSAHAPTIRLSKELGANSFVTKPDKFNDLVDILRSFLQ